MRKYLCFLMSFLGVSVWSQDSDGIDIERAEAFLSIDPYERSVSGEVRFFTAGKFKGDTLRVDAISMDLLSVHLNGSETDYFYDGRHLSIPLTTEYPGQQTIAIAYKVIPRKAMYFIGWNENRHADLRSYPENKGGRQVWTQGQGKYSSHWIPSFDDMTEKLEFDLEISFINGYEVLANGVLKNKEIGKEQTTWTYDMDAPMSSYLLAIAIGKYHSQNLTSSGGVKLMNYSYEGQTDRNDPTYKYTLAIFEFLEQETGVTYPWQNYKQVPVKNFLYSGMENTGLTIFSDTYHIDAIAFNDVNYINVNAHEMAHQWFGNYVTEASASHHWLHEGFATFYAYLAQKKIFNDDYYYWKLYESARQLKEESGNGNGKSLLNPGANSLTFYEKGAWALHILREQVGEADFRKAIKNYLTDKAYNTVKVEDFLTAVSRVSGSDLEKFKREWLIDSLFPYRQALTSLEKNAFMQQYLKLDAQFEQLRRNNLTPDQKEQLFADVYLALIGDSYFPIKERIIEEAYHFPDNYKDSIMRTGLTQDLKTRQAVAKHLELVPESMRKEFEGLLSDSSYVTIENALLKLWLSFPDRQKEYLKRTEGVFGFNSGNIRMLWLALSLVTEEVKEELKITYYQELVNYTNERYNNDIRSNAFRYLDELQAFNKESLISLVNATRSPVWQFSKFSSALLDELLSKPETILFIDQFKAELTKEELGIINKKMNGKD